MRGNNRGRALEIMREADWSITKIMEQLRKPENSELLFYVVRKSVLALKQGEKAAVRKAIKTEATGILSTGRREALRSIVSMLDGWTLSDGSTLGSATKAMLHDEAERAEQGADGLLKNAKFYRAVLKGMGNHRLVRQAYTEAQLEAISRRVWR